jgi:hypothetical protein
MLADRRTFPLVVIGNDPCARKATSDTRTP